MVQRSVSDVVFVLLDAEHEHRACFYDGSGGDGARCEDSPACGAFR